MTRLYRNAAIVAAILAAVSYSWLTLTTVSAKDLPLLKNGDIVFQTSRSSQSSAILLASMSAYSHMGIVEIHSDGTPFVVEAVAVNVIASPSLNVCPFVGAVNETLTVCGAGLHGFQKLPVCINNEITRSVFPKYLGNASVVATVLVYILFMMVWYVAFDPHIPAAKVDENVASFVVVVPPA